MYESIIREQVVVCIEQAEEYYNRSFPKPRVVFSNRLTRVIGQCEYKPSQCNKYTLKFSNKFMQANTPDQFNKVVAHEVAHMVQREVEGFTDHGRGFMAIMTKVFNMPEMGGKFAKGINSHTEHRKRVRHLYKCPDCGTICHLTTVKHNKAQRGNARYTHANCDSIIVSLGTKKEY